LRVGTTTLVDGLVAGFQLAGLVALSVLGLLSVSSAYLVLGLACAVPTCLWLVSRAQPLRFNRRLVLEHWRQNWSFGRWALASQLAGRATGYALPWTLAWIHGEASTGLLAACVTLVNIIGTFITGVSNYLTPRAASAYTAGGVTELYRVLRRVACLYLSVVGAFVVVLVFWGGRVSALVYGPQYAGGDDVIRLLALALLANSLSITVGNGLWAINRPDANFTADVCTLVTGLLVLAITVVAWGAVGAACALLVGNVVGMLVRWQTLRTAIAALSAEGAGS
jgi:O-antigen/teichoic acid export membrane protein